MPHCCFNSKTQCGSRTRSVKPKSSGCIAPKEICGFCGIYLATCRIICPANCGITCPAPCCKTCPASCVPPSLSKKHSCDRIIRPKRAILNKLFWCDCRPPLDKRTCEICQERAADLARAKKEQELARKKKQQERRY